MYDGEAADVVEVADVGVAERCNRLRVMRSLKASAATLMATSRPSRGSCAR